MKPGWDGHRGTLSVAFGHRRLEGNKVRNRLREADRQQVSTVFPVTSKDLTSPDDE